MVSPIFLPAIALLVAFILGLADRLGRGLSIGLTLGTLAWMVGLSGAWLVALLGGAAAPEVLTAGFAPPFSINLRMGSLEAGLALAVNLAFLGSGVLLTRRFLRGHLGAQILLLMMAMGTNGLILTRDLFNVFVFLEITAIATYGMIALHDDQRGLSAGFKYVIAGGLASALFLIGTIYLYRVTGTLNIDGMILAAQGSEVLTGGAGFVAVFLVVAALLIELKPFPANGWALDVYEASEPAVASIISVGTSGGIVAALYKIVPMIPGPQLSVLVGVGVLTFGLSNLMGLRQRQVRRMLGYSSVAQLGLVVATVSLAHLQDWGIGTSLLVSGGLLVNHLLAKGGLFWIASSLGFEGLADLARRLRRGGDGTRRRRGLLIAAGLFVIALAGLPPFPAFWAKWTLITQLAGAGSVLWIVVILLGSLLEATYLFRFLGAALTPQVLGEVAGEHAGGETAGAAAAAAGDARSAASARGVTASPRAAAAAAATAPARIGETLTGAPRTGVADGPPGVFAVMLLVLGPLSAWLFGFREVLLFVPFAAAVALWVLDWLPARVKALLTVAAIAGFGWLVYPLLEGMGVVLLGIFAGGGVIASLALLNRRRRATGLFPLVAALTLSMVSLLAAESSPGFFFAFETVTLSSYLLLLRRPGAARAALRYLVFSVGGTFLLMVGLVYLGLTGAAFGFPHVASATLAPDAAALLGPAVAELAVPALSGTTAGALNAGAGAALGVGAGVPLAALILIVAGLLVKAGAVGVQIWLPGAYAEAEDDLSPVFSGILSKVPVAGLLVVGMLLVTTAGAADLMLAIVGWIGALTALFGALLAVYQSDVKYLLAYSSMSQLGYIIMAVAMASQLGWSTGLYLSVLHLVFKGMLFLAVAGVIFRTGTSRMHELGGLIKKMPLTFISSLMAIIAVSGVPPLAGFGGKWMLYTALLERGWYFQAALAFFASTVAFLYLFKFIHTIFLGQLKDTHREVREAPFWLILPQLLLAGGLMGVSMYPNVLLQPLLSTTGAYLGTATVMERYTVLSTLGYWNGNLVMYVTMVVFIVPLVWLMVVMRRPQAIGQFNIVYAAERPARPETTHFAHHFFAHYDKALGFLSRPGVIAFWAGVRDGVNAAGSAMRRIYSGNGQTYALHILLFVVALYVIAGGLS